MTNTPYICCADCIWCGNCPDRELTTDPEQLSVAGVICDDYTPGDGRDLIDDYQRDLNERAAAYDQLLLEFQ